MASWDMELAEPIALSSGRRRFRTLRDAATFLAKDYGKARGGVLEGAIADLMAAAENPTSEQIRRATDQFARFLADQNLIATRSSSTGNDLENRIREMLAGRRPKSGQAKVTAGMKRRRK
ncbi:MAG: hypothetical protein ACT6XY_16855 [Phreatobacter sp.]|jgi:hypothetical protein|uniref:hypothetical protein n=1 Tax=Phreatobacter sp. TaxID=1966341 RepID=UPI0040350A8C